MGAGLGSFQAIGLSVLQRVYIVDDDEAVRDSLRSLLESHAFDVEDFASGPAFLDRYSADLQGCLILDVNMPDIDGFEVMNRLGPPRGEFPVLMMTARGDPAIETRARDAGAVAFIRKPFVARRLIELVRGATGSQP